MMKKFNFSFYLEGDFNWNLTHFYMILQFQIQDVYKINMV